MSYASEDSELARKIKDVLEEQNINVFLAELSLEPGSDWSDEIKNNLVSSQWVLFLATENSCNSNRSLQEAGYAYFSDKRIFPVLWDIEAEELPGWLDEKQAIDITHENSRRAKRKNWRNC